MNSHVIGNQRQKKELPTLFHPMVRCHEVKMNFSSPAPRWFVYSVHPLPISRKWQQWRFFIDQSPKYKRRNLQYLLTGTTAKTNNINNYCQTFLFFNASFNDARHETPISRLA